METVSDMVPGAMTTHEPEFFRGISGAPVHLRLESVTLRVRDRFLLAETSWEIRPGENWVVVGPNGAGKTSLMGALAGTVPVVRGRIHRSWDPTRENPVGYVSFEQQRRLAVREELRREARCFSGRIRQVTTAGDLLVEAAEASGRCGDDVDAAAAWIGIPGLLGRPMANLSTGEMRKVLIARALIGRPRLLLLDEPFGGLDQASREGLKRAIAGMLFHGMQIVLVTHRFEDVPPGFSKCLEVSGDRVRVRPWVGAAAHGMTAAGGRERGPASALTDDREHAGGAADILVEFRDVTVRYEGFVVLGHLDWMFRRGENWALTGPNGAGKTTLLRLISADIEQAYANEIYLFGRRRGTGETIWEIKHHIGLLGSEMQLRYRKSISVEDVVVSGFYDSVGLYRTPGPDEQKTARDWLERLGLTHLSHRMFDRLSYGEQRLVLMARAVVKTPRLLILDEPCQGLDPDNRRRMLKLSDRIGRSGNTHLLFVTHHESEIPGSVNRVLRIDRPVDGKTPAQIRKLPRRSTAV